MGPLRFLGILVVIVSIIIGLTWYFTTPECPNVPGYKAQHPNVQCR